MKFFGLFNHKKVTSSSADSSSSRSPSLVDNSFYTVIPKTNGNRTNLKVQFSDPLFVVIDKMASSNSSSSASLSSSIDSSNHINAIIHAAQAMPIAQVSRDVDGFFYVHNKHAFRSMMREYNRIRLDTDNHNEMKRTTKNALHSMVGNSFDRPALSIISEAGECEDPANVPAQELEQDAEQVVAQDAYDDLPDYVDFPDSDSDSEFDDDEIVDDNEVADDASSVYSAASATSHQSRSSDASFAYSDLSDDAIIGDEGEFEYFVAQEGAEPAQSPSVASTESLTCSSLHTLEFEDRYSSSCTGLGAFFRRRHRASLSRHH